MAKYGQVVSVLNPEIQTELTADAAAGATVLTVESTHQFNNDPGEMVAIADQDPVEIVSSSDTTITLASGLASAASDGEPVTLVRGGQRATFWDAEVDFGDGETVPVPIGFDQREKWPPGPYDPPVPVLVSDDLSEIIDAPGRTPSIEDTYIYTPAAKAAKGSNQAIPHSTWTTLIGWFTFRLDDVTYDAGTGWFTVNRDGEYDVRLGVSFDTNTTGTRAIRMHTSYLGLDLGPSRDVRVPSEGYVGLETNQSVSIAGGTQLYFEVFQNNSGAGNLDVLGSNVFTSQPKTECSIRRVGPK